MINTLAKARLIRTSKPTESQPALIAFALLTPVLRELIAALSASRRLAFTPLGYFQERIYRKNASSAAPVERTGFA